MENEIIKKDGNKEELKDKNSKNIPESIEHFTKQLSKVFDKKDLAKKIIEYQPCYYDKARNWWLWNWPQTKWERVDETDILNAIETQAVINTINSKEKNEMLEALKQVSRNDAPANIKSTWIQFKNTIMDLKNGNTFRAQPYWFVTNPIPIELHKEKFIETPTIDRIFGEWVGEENIKILYEIIAYCLLPDYPIHRIFCLIGSGMNGKSCFLNLLRKFIGNSNVCSTELDTLLNSRFEITRLHKKLVCIMGETNFSKIEKTSILKKLTGGDLVGFEYKNKDPFEDVNYAKIIIATNNLPTTDDKTIGFYRRWIIIDFPNQFSEKKNILDDIPEEEYNALAIKCCFILKDIIDNRSFSKEGSIEDRIKKYEDHSNPLDKFWKENIIEDFNSFIFKHDFRDKLIQWCKENRFREISDRTIAEFMKEKNIGSSQKYADWFTKEGNKPFLRTWEGINWNN